MAEDVKGSLEKRQAARPGHLKRIGKLLNEGRLIMAGAHPAIDNIDPGPAGFTGSLIVAEFNSLQDAQDWIQADPFVSMGVYSRITVKPYKRVY